MKGKSKGNQRGYDWYDDYGYYPIIFPLISYDGNMMGNWSILRAQYDLYYGNIMIDMRIIGLWGCYSMGNWMEFKYHTNLWGLFWYYLWGYLVWDIIKWDIMKYQWVMMIGIWWDIDLYCGLYVIHIMGILWEYDRNMMGIWWLSWGYCGKSLGVLWECCRYLIKYQWEYDEFPKTWWLSYGGFHKWGIPQMSSVQNPSLIPLDWLFNIDSPIGLL